MTRLVPGSLVECEWVVAISIAGLLLDHGNSELNNHPPVTALIK